MLIFEKLLQITLSILSYLILSYLKHLILLKTIIEVFLFFKNYFNEAIKIGKSVKLKSVFFDSDQFTNLFIFDFWFYFFFWKFILSCLMWNSLKFWIYFNSDLCCVNIVHVQENGIYFFIPNFIYHISWIVRQRTWSYSVTFFQIILLYCVYFHFFFSNYSLVLCLFPSIFFFISWSYGI